MGRYFNWWQGFDQICHAFTVSLTVPQKLYSEVAVFTPANHRDFHCQGGWFLSYSNLQREIGSCIQRNVAAHTTTSGREVEQDPFSGVGIALDTGKVADRHSKATSWLHRSILRRELLQAVQEPSVTAYTIQRISAEARKT
ncbi:MAG: hypothetical protein A2V62_07815 [Nitrospirae bacterium RBG_19FT_COMBO_58_9]|nr:MAG: hypothetical protein A2V62_07815 [Nitrospirae bacterium RBG_19FT_COMBO_58_9]